MVSPLWVKTRRQQKAADAHKCTALVEKDKDRKVIKKSLLMSKHTISKILNTAFKKFE
jgi:hypothetical protein